VVDDALSRKAESMGSMAYLPVAERPLITDVQAFANLFVRLIVSEPSRILACIVAVNPWRVSRLANWMILTYWY